MTVPTVSNLRTYSNCDDPACEFQKSEGYDGMKLIHLYLKNKNL